MKYLNPYERQSKHKEMLDKIEKYKTSKADEIYYILEDLSNIDSLDFSRDSIRSVISSFQHDDDYTVAYIQIIYSVDIKRGKYGSYSQSSAEYLLQQATLSTALAKLVKRYTDIKFDLVQVNKFSAGEGQFDITLNGVENTSIKNEENNI